MDTILKYPWQQSVLDAYVEFRPEYLPEKINAAERTIVERLRDPRQPDVDEQSALEDALHALRVLFLPATEKPQQNWTTTEINNC